MNYNKFFLTILLGITLILFSCGNKSGTLPASKKSNPPKAESQSNSIDPGEKEVGNEFAPFADILEKDIFTPPDMRSSMKTPIPTEEKLAEPQKLTITGIVFDGSQYLVSVENLDIGESNYLKVNDQLVDYSIVTIDFDKVTARKKKVVKTYQVGDQIPIPGTEIQQLTKSAVSEDTTDLEIPTIKTEIPTAAVGTGDSLEERLRKRRQQQEEELK